MGGYYDIMNDIGAFMGSRLMRVMSIFGFLLVGNRCIHGSVQCTCFQSYVSFHPHIFMG